MGKGSTPGQSVTGLSRLYLWIALFLISAGMLAQQLQIRGYADQTIEAYYTQPLAQQLAGNLSTQLAQTLKLQKAFADHPLSIAYLARSTSDGASSNDPASTSPDSTSPDSRVVEPPVETLNWSEQIVGLIPGAIHAELLSADAAADLSEGYNFSVQDLANKALKGQELSIEATRLNSGIRYFAVSPVTGDEGITGLLLVEYGKDWENSLWQSLGEQTDQVAIYQSVSGPENTGLSLWSVNPGKGQNKQFTLPVNDTWYVTVTPALQLTTVQMLYAAVPWFFTLALTFAALFMLHGYIHSRMRRDQKKLYSYLSYDFAAGESAPPEFSLRLFSELAELIHSLVSPVSQTSQTSGDSSPITDEFFAGLNDKGTDKGKDKPNGELPVSVAESATTPDLNAEPSTSKELPAIEFSDEQPKELSGELALPEEIPGTDIPGHIFRAYDIRGLVKDELTTEVATLIGRALGSELKEKDIHKVQLAWDGRHSSQDLANAVQEGLLRSGINVNRLGQVPVGVLYYATHVSDTECGVMITGSHNPAEYNGMKIVVARQPLTAKQIQHLKERIQQGRYVTDTTALVTEKPLLDDYLKRITTDLSLHRPMTVVIDAGNGVAGPAAESLFRALGAEVVPLYCDIDGDFPNHHPDPGIAANLMDLRQSVLKYGADLGLAFDGDGDRVALVDDQGRIVSPDHILMLLIEDILPRNPGRDVVYDVKSSRYLSSFIARVGGRPTMWKTGHSMMKQKMHELRAVVGGEYSGHFYINDRWYGFDDGLYNGARLLEVLSARSGATVADVFSDFPADVSTDEITLETGEERKFPLIEALRHDDTLQADARTTDIDGLRIEYTDGWGLIRASNTTPKLTLRFAGSTQSTILRIQAAFRQALKREAPDLDIPF